MVNKVFFLVFVNMYSVYIKSDNWKVPKEFRPDRWIGNDD